jgi:hypothetical protein
MSEFLIAALPLLVLVASLLFGLYPGCETMVRLAERIGAESEHAEATSHRQPAPPPAHAASGGLLIAFGHAQRPPPLTA